MNGFYRQVAELLRQHGYSMVRQGGTAHQIWSNGIRSVTVSTNCYSRHTANAILRQAGILHRFK